MKIAVSVGHFKGEMNKDIEYPNNKVYAEILHGILIANGVQADLFEGHLPDKVRAINAFRPDIAVECHFNALEWPFNPRNCGSGYETCINVGSIRGRLLATAIVEAFEKRIPTHRRGLGIQERDDLYFLKKTVCPAVILEPLFLDNPTEAAFLAMKRGHEFLALAAYEGILKYAERGAGHGVEKNP